MSRKVVLDSWCDTHVSSSSSDTHISSSSSETHVSSSSSDTQEEDTRVSRKVVRGSCLELMRQNLALQSRSSILLKWRQVYVSSSSSDTHVSSSSYDTLYNTHVSSCCNGGRCLCLCPCLCFCLCLSVRVCPSLCLCVNSCVCCVSLCVDGGVLGCGCIHWMDVRWCVDGGVLVCGCIHWMVVRWCVDLYPHVSGWRCVGV